jgi:signal transduction histidine kinase
VTGDLAYEPGREPERHTSELETAQYRILQEALTNVVKHVNARRALVTIVEQRDLVTLTVQDDGRGFEPRDHLSGLVLLGMRERAETLAGELVVESAPGRGPRSQRFSRCVAEGPGKTLLG